MLRSFITLLLLITSAGPLAAAQLDNGFEFDSTPPGQRIELTLTIKGGAFSEVRPGINRLVACSLLQETEHYQWSDIAHFLKRTNQDLLARSHVTETPFSTKISLTLSDASDIEEALMLVRDFLHHGTLSQKALELARAELLEVTDDPVLIHNLKTFTPYQLRHHYREWFRPDMAKLTLSHPIDSALESTIIALFSPLGHGDEPSPRDLFTERESISRLSHETVVIDGKIIMNRPSFFETRQFWNGVAAACGLAALGIGAVVALATPGGQPIGLAIACVPAFIGTGVYLIPNHYSDPIVIEEKRAEDLKYGFKHACQRGRAHLTLTPYERRNLFIASYSSRPMIDCMSLSQYPIADLVDIFRLESSTFTEMLHENERAVLWGITDEFLTHRNDLSFSKKLCQQELNELLASHQTLRDMALDQAEKIFNQRIAEANTEQEVELAEECLDYEKKRILIEYEAWVIECKRLIHYDTRMAQIEAGAWSLYHYYSEVFIDAVSRMTPGDPSFIDIVDLRH